MTSRFTWVLLLLMAGHCLAEPLRAAEDAGPAGPAGPAGELVACSRVVALMAECFTFLRGLQTTPPAVCCSGLQRLSQMVSTPDDKQLACKCLNRVLPLFRQLQPTALSELPKQCHLKASFSPGDC